MSTGEDFRRYEDFHRYDHNSYGPLLPWPISKDDYQQAMDGLAKAKDDLEKTKTAYGRNTDIVPDDGTHCSSKTQPIEEFMGDDGFMDDDGSFMINGINIDHYIDANF